MPDLTPRERILREIKRTAAAIGGTPLGYRSFAARANARVNDWWKYWPNWSDAVREAGLLPNQPIEAYTDEHLIEQLIALTRRLGHYPNWREWRLEKRGNPELLPVYFANASAPPMRSHNGSSNTARPVMRMRTCSRS